MGYGEAIFSTFMITLRTYNNLYHYVNIVIRVDNVGNINHNKEVKQEV